MYASAESSLTADLLKIGIRNNLNKYTLDQMRRSGVEVKEVARGPRKGALIVNPLLRLYNSGKLTRQEFAAGTYYQMQYGISNRSHHSRPGDYDTSVSSYSTTFKEGGPNQEQMEASRYITRIKTHLSLAANYETKWLNGEPKYVEQKLPEILVAVFEKEIKIRKEKNDEKLSVEELLKSDYRTIQMKVKKICEIMLDI